MNLIEQLGGYEKAKLEFEARKRSGIHACELERGLLQYRRENNIFENNDFVVHMHDYENSMLFKVKEISDSGYSYGNDWGWYGVISNMGVGYTFRHATPEEIKAGRRL